MSDFNKILWGFIFSGTGIAFGWILNQLGQWLRVRQEDKRNLKLVLYNQLETYFIFVRSDFNKFAEQLTNKIFKKIPEAERTEELKKTITSLYSDILTDYFKPELLDKLKTVQENYQNCIKILASIDPLTAYYLSGETSVIERFDKIQTFLNQLKQQFPNDIIQIENGVKQILETIKPEITNDALNELEKDIRKVAWKINPYVWFKSIGALKRIKVNANERLDDEIEKLMNKVSVIFGVQ